MLKRITLIAGVLIALACGGGGGGGGTGGGGGGGNNGVVLNVNSASLAFNQTLNLSATVPGEASQTVSWTTTGGTITPLSATQAQFRAPASGPGTFTVTARSSANTAKFGTCVITVSQVGITISPEDARVNPSGKVRFTGTVSGSTSLRANFSATGGTFVRFNDSEVEWTAPATEGNYTVTATAAANSARKATATVTVANVGANAIVRGQVRNEFTSAAVPGVTVTFLNATGQELARHTTGVDGFFQGAVPVTARRLHVIRDTVSTFFYAQYSFNNLRYTTLIPDCTAPLPTLTAGNTTVVSSVLLWPTDQAPPPPPNGCTIP